MIKEFFDKNHRNYDIVERIVDELLNKYKIKKTIIDIIDIQKKQKNNSIKCHIRYNINNYMSIIELSQDDMIFSFDGLDSFHSDVVQKLFNLFFFENIKSTYHNIKFAMRRDSSKIYPLVQFEDGIPDFIPYTKFTRTEIKRYEYTQDSSNIHTETVFNLDGTRIRKGEWILKKDIRYNIYLNTLNSRLYHDYYVFSDEELCYSEFDIFDLDYIVSFLNMKKK